MSLPGFTRIDGSFWTEDLPPDLSQFGAVSQLAGEPGRGDPTGRSKGSFHLRLDELDLGALFRALRERSVRLVRCRLTPTYERGFWEPAPEDCVGAILRPDGSAGLADFKAPRRIIPLGEPLVIRTRPSADVEHGSGPPPHLLCEGGIPILSERLLASLRDLGAEGETADVIYRGPYKGRPDTIQTGYKRFLPRREIDIGGAPSIDLLPEGLAEGFGICALRRSIGDSVTLYIALDRSATEQLRRRRRTVLMGPIFRRDGPVGTLVRAVAEGACNLGAGPIA
jgi:hypothetical protein